MKMHRAIRIHLYFALLSIAAVNCGGPAKDVPFDGLRAAAARAGWVERTDQFRSFTSADFYKYVGAEAAVHMDRGLLRGIGVTASSQGRVADIYFEDFGSPSRARAMVQAKKNSSSGPGKIPGVKVAPALYCEAVGGCVAFWARGRCYVEMSLTGYKSPDAAVRDAAMLIDTLSAVMK
jgi:hypothetical protein